MLEKIVVITGPTAAGKTGLGVRLAQQFGGEVVSADSMQVYRGLNVGTAKPSALEMDGVPHHMIDVAEPGEAYSVARYVAEARDCADDILRRGKLPILVGGTGLYIDSLLAGRDFAAKSEEGDERAAECRPYRDALAERYEREGAETLWRELQEVDPETAERLHPNDKKRVLRALEVYQLTGQTMTAHNAATRRVPPRYEAVKIALTARERGDLYRRVDKRVDAMLDAGLYAEVADLLQSGLPPACTAMQAIGYKEMARAVAGEISLEEAAALIKQESRRYAKRQLSWLRRDETVRWIEWDGEPDFAEAVRVSTEFCRDAGIMDR
ncbi:MAG: tRNA (adenosine(37)-N6)-dimethylallyltransferase MiaA [Oscillospiraceae bacterium]|nr:tRNA (adenosine(37)-N6)-dimethylallyltransferase MiaA [Oscillospiraceae bacterium]